MPHARQSEQTKKAVNSSGAIRLHPKAQRLQFDFPGPFVKLGPSHFLTIDSRGTLRTRDGGKTWIGQPFFNYAPHDKEYKLSNERVFFRTKAGTVLASFVNLNEKRWLWRNELKDALPGNRLPQYVFRSSDAGKTWEEPIFLHDAWTGEVRSLIQLLTGRLVLSTQMLIHNPGRHGVLTYTSDDDGRTWKPSPLIDLGGSGHHDGVIEATIAELRDGRVWMLLRTNWGKFWQAFSHDGGRTWREIGPSNIDASSSPGQLLRLRSGRLMLCWNRYMHTDGRKPVLKGGDGVLCDTPASWQREELSIAFSEDDGKAWSRPVVVATKADAWLSYPRLLEPCPGEIWITTMQGPVRLRIAERDFIA